MDDDPHVVDKGWDALPEYAAQHEDADDAVTVSISTTPGEWLVNTTDSVVVPMSMAELVEGLRAGALTERSLVWRQGMQEWSVVAGVPQLKLAARLPSRPKPEKPSAPPVRQTPAPHMLSRRSTLPFGLATPPGSRPAHAKPVLPPASDEPGVLAVYARPAATISFDLSPEQPLRAEQARPREQPARPKVSSTPVPETLAPMTSDSGPRALSAHRVSDLSVVAAADFRAVQKSGNRSVLVWSLVSAAAASVLTFWLARSGAVTEPAAASAREPATLLAPVSTPPVSAPPAAESAVAPEVAAPEAAPAPSATPSSKPALTTPARKPPRWVPRKPKPAAESVAPLTAERLPSAEPNPYDLKPDDAATAKPPATGSSGLEDTAGSESSTGDGSKTPGF